jgi:hypothetical protein
VPIPGGRSVGESFKRDGPGSFVPPRDVGSEMSRAVIQEQFGGPEVLEVRDVAEPHAGHGEVRVRVSATGSAH